jgi:hypothetical protein
MGTTQLRGMLLLSVSMLTSHAYGAGAVGASTATVVNPISISADDLQLRFAKGRPAAEGRIDTGGSGGMAHTIEVSQAATEIVASGGILTVMPSLTISYE